MPWHLQNLNDNPKDLYYSDSHIELNCVFYKDGKAVEVINPAASFSPSTPTKVLRAFARTDDLEPPVKYTTTFLTTGLSPGTYTVDFTGVYNSETLHVSGEFSLYTVAREQALINTLRSLLKDTLPQLYIVNIPDQDTFKWRDGELYDCIMQAQNLMNSAPPSTIKFTLSNNPFESYLLNFAVMYALQQRQMLEIQNAINYSDEINFNIDRAGKYASVANVYASFWWQQWILTKKDYNFHQIQHAAVISNRYPLHFIRPLSLLPNSKNTFGYY